MKKISFIILAASALLLMNSCAGIKYMSIETREPAQIALPTGIKSVLIVNNVVQQPDEIGHNIKPLGRQQSERAKASSDSVPIFYTEAMAQFMGEEGFFEQVKFYQKPLRSDNDFWKETPIAPDVMQSLRSATGTDAIISLDKLIIQTDQVDFFEQQGYKYKQMVAKINSVVRVYLPSMDGKIPVVQLTDSLRWEGFDIQDGNAFADQVLPSRSEAMKQLAVLAAEKMTKVFSPHWEKQDRWYYTTMNSEMREGETLSKANKWAEAVERWKAFYNKEGVSQNKAMAAHNIALGYEMLGEMDTAYEWANTAADLFQKTTTDGSLERRRSFLFKNEIQRRRDTSNKLNMQN